MAMFILKINLNNSAYRESNGELDLIALAETLENLSDRIKSVHDKESIREMEVFNYNGNEVGKLSITGKILNIET